MTEDLGTLGRYDLRDELGRGGMGVVYIAYDPQVERRVALKVISPQFGSDPDFRTRFQREMRIAAQLEHPHIVPVYETGTADGSLFMAMRLIPGSDLGQVLVPNTPLASDRVARLARHLGSALDAAHARGLVHRDVKPSNVLLTGEDDEEHAYLTDFGLTREASSQSGLTNTGQWVGTADFVAPEQLEGTAVTARSDVYSLSCLLYMCLTGCLPYEGTVARKLFAHLHSELPSVGPQVPHHEEVDAVLHRGAAKDPADRYPSAGDLARACAAALAGRATPIAERTVATGAALSGIASTVVDTEVPAPQIAATVSAPLPTASTPTQVVAVAPPAAPGPQPPPHDGGGGRGVVAAVIVVLVMASAAVAFVVASPSKDKKPISSALVRTTTRSTPAVISGGGGAPAATVPTAISGGGGAPSTPTPVAAAPLTPPTRTKHHHPGRATAKPVGAIKYESYTPPSGLYTAQVPVNRGWRNFGETPVNPRLFETKLHGPGHDQILIDATPVDRPIFGRAGRSHVQHNRFDSRYGPVDAWQFRGSKPKVCLLGPCTDYQLTVVNRPGIKGIAVLGGPTATARTVAARILTSAVPHRAGAG